jgi:hypothetical protein
MITPGDPHQQFSDILASLLIAVFGFPIVSFVALVSAPPWLVDFFERLDLVEDLQQPTPSSAVARCANSRLVNRKRVRNPSCTRRWT